MRLGTCVALEAVVGIAVLGGAATGAWYALGAARDYAASLSPAEASAASLPGRVLVTPIESSLGPAAEPAAAPGPDVVAPAGAPAPAPAATGTSAVATVFPASDEELLAPLRTGDVVATKLNRGGSSLSLRLDFTTGARAAFKPEQIWPQSKPRREIAAYRMDRYLHIGRVPPAIGRAFEVDALVAGFEPETRRHGAGRIDTEAEPRGKLLAGSVSWWIPEIEGARIRGFDVDSTDGVVTWRRLVRVGATIPDDERWLAEQLSTLALFDFVIDNIDRWTGGNVRIAPGGRELFFMDNTMSFTTDRLGHRKGQLYLQRVEVFSRDLVTRLRAMTADDLRAIMEPDRGPFASLLTDREIRATLARRDFAIAYIDRLIARHGEAVVLAFP